MVKLNSFSRDFIVSCIQRYEKENPHDVVRQFEPLPNTPQFILPSILMWNPKGDPTCHLVCPLGHGALKNTNNWTYSHTTGNNFSPLFLYGIGKNILVVSALLECDVCSEPIASHSDHILQQVNFPLPFSKSYKIGLSMDAFNLILKSIECGMNFQSIETMMEKLLKSHYGGQLSSEPLTYKSISRYEIVGLFLSDYEQKKPSFQKAMNGIKSYEISLDNTFRSVKGVSVTDGKRKLKQFGSICLVLNQDGLIVGRQAVVGSSVTAAKSMWENLVQNNPNIHRIDTGKLTSTVGFSHSLCFDH